MFAPSRIAVSFLGPGLSVSDLTRIMSTLWLARHANRQDFADPEWASTAERPHDPGLSPDGVEQARQLGQRVATLDVGRIVSSPYLRAVQTAHHVAEVVNKTVHLEPGLGEWLNAEWFDRPPNTRSPATLASRFDHVARRREPSVPCRQPSYPESKHEALARLGATGQCLVDRHPDDTLLLVGHGITVQGVLHGLLGSTVPDPGCPLASLTKVVRQNGTWTIQTRNDTRHLENGAHSTHRLA